MVIKQWADKFAEIIKKYRYALIVLLIGLILMAVPNIGAGNTISTNEESNRDISSVTALEDKLSSLLSKVDGAGEVEVILTVAAGEEIIYQTNDNKTNSDSSSSINTNTVTITDAQRNQTGLVKQVKTETYQGAIIVCQGADNLTVRLSIVEAVSRITGLGSNCISVLKMK